MTKTMETGMLRGRPFGGVITLITLMLLFCVLYELRDSNNRLTYCKLAQFLF